MKVQLIDCTFRDGGNFNNWLFTDNDINEVMENLDGAGIDIIEVGYRGGSGSNKAILVGQAAHCSKEFLERLPLTKQASLAVMVVPSSCPIKDLEDLDSKLVKWVRVASYPHNVKNALPYVEYLKSRGFNVGMNLMAASYSCTKDIQKIAKLGSEAGADVFYIADSFGALTPDDVSERIQSIVEVVSCPVGFHGHNNLGLAFVNTLEAIKSGASYIDTFPELKTDHIVTKYEGNTGLYKSDKIANFTGNRCTWVKAQSENPSGSFKDNGMTVAVSHGYSLGKTKFTCTSTGNTSSSLAMYASMANFESYIFVPNKNISVNKVLQTLSYGAKVVTFEGTYDNGIQFLEKNSQDLDLYVCNSINPFRIEGQKSIIYEIAQYLKWGFT